MDANCIKMSHSLQYFMIDIKKLYEIANLNLDNFQTEEKNEKYIKDMITLMSALPDIESCNSVKLSHRKMAFEIHADKLHTSNTDHMSNDDIFKNAQNHDNQYFICIKKDDI